MALAAIIILASYFVTKETPQTSLPNGASVANTEPIKSPVGSKNSKFPASTASPVLPEAEATPSETPELKYNPPVSVATSPVPASSPTFVEEKVDPTQPGNSLTIGNIVVSVVGVSRPPDAAENDLLIEVSPVSKSLPLPAPVAPVLGDEDTASGDSGYSSEEELFRAKWGWAAYDRVQRAALEDQTAAH